MEKMKQELAGAETRAKREREALDHVEAELLEMFANPELRKRYFAIVDLAEIEENEFNLNIPRYVDTFEPEEEIKIEAAATELNNALKKEQGFMLWPRLHSQIGTQPLASQARAQIFERPNWRTQRIPPATVQPAVHPLATDEVGNVFNQE